MNRSTLKHLTATALVTGFATVAFAVPASALEPIDPQGGLGAEFGTPPGPAPDDPWLEISLGALGGLVLAGAGVAAAQSARRRSTVPTS